MRYFVLSGLWIALVSPANAEMTALDLQKACTEKQNVVGDLTCTAFIAGFMVGLKMGHAAGVDVKYCPPDTLVVGDARQIIEKYMIDHPDTLNSNPGTTAASALWGAFPCKD